MAILKRIELGVRSGGGRRERSDSFTPLQQARPLSNLLN